MIKKLLTFVALSVATIFSANAQTAASAVDGKKQTLFDSSNHVSTPYRIPAIATLNNGTVLAIADQRPCGADVGHGEVDIYAKIGTTDANGDYKNWNPSSTDPSADDTINPIIDGSSSCGYGDAAVAVDPETGHILLLSVGGNDVFGETKASGDYKTMRHVSTDNGVNWSTSEITPIFKGSSSLLKDKDVCSMFFASGKLLVSSYKAPNAQYNRIYGALLTSEEASWSLFGGWSDKNYNYVFYTDDLGESWSLLGDGSCISGADEAKVEELPNGDILVSSRTTGGRKFNVYDMSEGNWGTEQTYTFASNCKATNGELMMYRGVIDVKTNAKVDILLQSLPIAENRSKVSVYYTVVDENSTLSTICTSNNWTKGIQIYDAESAYSAMTIMPNGEIGFFYEEDYFSSNNNDNKKTGYASGGTANMVFVPLTVEEITGGAFKHVAATAPTFSHSGEVTEGTQVTISAEEGTTIYYTTDGAAPSRASTKYTGAITVNSAMTINAIAVKDCDYTYSAVATASFTIKAPAVKVETPTFSPAGGEVEEGTTVTISCATEGATVYYTTDGTTPTKSSAVYSGAITVDKAMTIKAFAAKDGYTDSEIVSATFTIKAREVVATPVINPAGGEVEAGTTVTISCATDGATIYYTTDGNEPTTASAVYSGAITVNSAMTIKAMAAKEGYYTNSAVATASFTIKAREVVATPVINPAGGEVEEGTAVTISCATDGATIYYTTDGNEPTTASAVYSGAITVNSEMTIKAFAAKEGYYTNSAVATASFTIKEVVVEPEVTEYPVTPVAGNIGDTEYYLATFSANENTVAPAGVTVFYVKNVSNEEVALTRVSSGKAIPAGEGVILMASSADAFNMTSTTDESNVADLSDNCLVGTVGTADFTFEVENCYALAVKGSGELAGQFAFCKVAVRTTLNGYNNRAYLDLSASAASFSNNVRVSFDGITGVESVVNEFVEDVIYDLCGRRVHEMKPGNIYIVNGKKVLKK